MQMGKRLLLFSIRTVTKRTNLDNQMPHKTCSVFIISNMNIFSRLRPVHTECGAVRSVSARSVNGTLLLTAKAR